MFEQASDTSILRVLATGLLRRVRVDDAAQAVYGVDAISELALHDELETGLIGNEICYRREVPYESGRDARRCDFVLDCPDLSIRSLWIEVKRLGQYQHGEPNRHYAKALQQPVTADVRKLVEAPIVVRGAVLLVLFAADQETAHHDMDVWAERCADAGLPVLCGQRIDMGITDRQGNAHMTMALATVKDEAPLRSGRFRWPST